MKLQNKAEEGVGGLFSQDCLKFVVETLSGSAKYVDLDNAATTSAFREVEEEIRKTLTFYGSVHRGSGQKSKESTDAYERARDIILTFVGASEDNYVVFTKNTTESINHAAALWSKIPGKVLVSDIEHSSNLLPWLQTGQIVQYKTDAKGRVDVEEVEKQLAKGDIKLLTITGSSNVTGYKPPIYEMAELAHKYGAKILVDVCQLIQHNQVDVLDSSDPRHIDLIAFSGHKMYAPFGAGVLVGPKEFFDDADPYQIGGGNLPYITRDLEIKRFSTVQAHDPGTPNAIGALAIGKAAEIIERIGYKRIHAHESSIVEQAYVGIEKLSNVEVYVGSDELGSVLPFNIKGIDHRLTAEILANEYGVGVRAGSFCTYELIRKLHGLSPSVDNLISEEVDQGITKNIPGLVRASFSLVNNQEDVKRFVIAITEIANTNLQKYLQTYEQNSTTGDWTYRGEKNAD
ncbi:aminotransferase class V-fold PLP-dependent enzyme [Candidatus Woesearchaeota archaeon]|nr:aminotransferase class V-fold PLP-dependent enzyme [Candidatus Woesearchaeota archaeon]